MLGAPQIFSVILISSLGRFLFVMSKAMPYKMVRRFCKPTKPHIFICRLFVLFFLDKTALIVQGPKLVNPRYQSSVSSGQTLTPTRQIPPQILRCSVSQRGKHSFFCENEGSTQFSSNICFVDCLATMFNYQNFFCEGNFFRWFFFCRRQPLNDSIGRRWW